jgi:diguanylate cyclase (GGDEF)-like protein/PAS domain S-box-containing protein
MKTSEIASFVEVMDLMLDAVCVVDRDGHFVFVSAAFERIFGYAPVDVIGKSMIDFVFAEDRGRTLQTVDILLSGELKPRFENRWVHKDGRIIDVLWSARWSEEHQVRIAVAHDISERKQMEQRLLHMAGHDPLTDLPNRALLEDRVQAALARVRRDQTHLSLLFIDLDGFKYVNDCHGHVVGDKLLQHFAQRLRACVRESDTVGRLGGDEFLVCLAGTGLPDDVMMIAEKVRAELGEPVVLGGISLHLTPSIGIAHYPQHGDDEQQLIQCADQAMYRAKRVGGNRIEVFSDDNAVYSNDGDGGLNK